MTPEAPASKSSDRRRCLLADHHLGDGQCRGDRVRQRRPVHRERLESVVLEFTAAAAPATASAAILSSGSGTVTVRDSVLGGVSSVYQFGTSTFRIANTQILGGVPAPSMTCVGAYNSAFVPLGPACTPIP